MIGGGLMLASAARPLLRLMPALAVLVAPPAIGEHAQVTSTQLGPRPFYLLDEMTEGPLKRELAACAVDRNRYEPSDFSVGHRGAPLQFPEHTKESYLAAARMGAGVLECDVTFTRDRELVCRHAQCDLHRTTNILATPLAARCSRPFTPAEFDPETGERIAPASARCCASDITAAEFRTLSGKMDAYDPDALTVQEYLGGTTDFRTELYATGGTLLTHAESIALFQSLGRQFAPELKAPAVPMPFEGDFAREDYALKLVEEYREAGIDPARVRLQSFSADDVRLWIDQAPEFGRQAILLEGRDPEELAAGPPSIAEFRALKRRGINFVAPPMQVLVTADGDGMAPSEYARRARAAGLELLSWTTERSGRVVEDIVAAGGAFYYDSTAHVLRSDGDILETIHVLAREVGIVGLFSDWPATTTFYANCMEVRRPPAAGGPERDR